MGSDLDQHDSTRRRTWRSTMLVSGTVVLANPPLIGVALAGFLARGGIVLLALPIIVLPTPAGLANVLAPAIVPFYFGTASPLVILYAGIGLAVAAAWLLAGGVVGAWADATLTHDVAADEELDVGVRGPESSARLLLPALLVRVLAHAPLVVALAVSAPRIYAATFAELTSPFEVVTPLIVRILSDVPDAIAGVTVALVLGEAAGGIAVRHLVLGGRSIAGAAARGWLELVRRPHTSLATLLVTDGLVVAAIGLTFLASGVTWSFVEQVVLDDDAAALILASVIALVAAWVGGIVVTGVAVAFRAAAWTAEWLRSRAVPAPADPPQLDAAVGTIGGNEERRPGDWSSARPSGNL